tara:strand:+ start:42410 stop:42757 length:348 start_codon:yes stop_codon:yes gene_type:complete
MKQFTVLQKHHYGWSKRSHKAKSQKEAIIQDILHDHPFLNDYKGKYKIELNKNRYRVIWTDNNAKECAFNHTVEKGSTWFANNIHIGSKNSCDCCGDTKEDFYNPFISCNSCKTV